MSAVIIRLCDRRAETNVDLDIDLHTAIEVAVRDLLEIEAHWGTERARARLAECRSMLRAVLAVS